MIVAIKGMEIPINCTRCPCSDDDARFCRAANEYIPMLGKPGFCPLIEAEPERKKGKWIKMSDADGIFYACSDCGEWHEEISNYCPNCGANMKGE